MWPPLEIRGGGAEGGGERRLEGREKRENLEENKRGEREREREREYSLMEREKGK